jgi:dTDP-4-amino-4,6-dideoxygalactose transaminase
MANKANTIPLVDLRAQYLSIKAEIDGAIERVIDQSAFIGGTEVARFEAAFAAYCEAKACVSVANGTDALIVSLRALGIGSGDEVITVAHTFIATAEAISAVGAKPVFVDVSKNTMLMDPEAFEIAITPRTRAVIPVHLYGHPCDLDRILEIARRHELKVIEDAAQAHGARWRGKRVGAMGDLACFSFYPGKNLGAYGDGAVVVSQDEELIQWIRMYANHGRREKYTHEMVGINSRLDGLQAAILRVKLPHLDNWNSIRRHHADYYRHALRDCPIVLPAVHPEAEHVWHLFVVRVQDRNGLRRHLREHAIEAGIHYPIPVHRQPAYLKLGYATVSLPVTEQSAEQVVSLPLYPELTEQQLCYVIEMIKSYLRETAR